MLGLQGAVLHLAILQCWQGTARIRCACTLKSRPRISSNYRETVDPALHCRLQCSDMLTRTLWPWVSCWAWEYSICQLKLQIQLNIYILLLYNCIYIYMYWNIFTYIVLDLLYTTCSVRLLQYWDSIIWCSLGWGLRRSAREFVVLVADDGCKYALNKTQS